MANFFHALKWSLAGELASRALQPLAFIILARLLTPDAYGVMAAAILVISFTQVFWEAGMSKAIIQRQTDIESSANAAFWINIGLGLLIAGILFLFSGVIAKHLFQDMRVADVLRVMTIQIFLGAASSIHTALLQKEMKFNRLFWVRITTIGVPVFFSIPLAFYGMSYWALVVGTLVGQAAQVIVLWKISKWRPHVSFNIKLAKELSRFGSWVGLTGLLAWCYTWMDSIFVGTYLGTHDLGLYRTGNQFIIMIYGFLFAPLLPVLYSHFSSIQGDFEKLKIVMFKIVRIITLISVPLAFLMYTLKESIGFVVFGEKWIGIQFILGMMALTHGYSWIVGANGEIYRAIGKPSYETVVTIICLPMYLIGYFVSIKYGLETFVWTRFFLAIAAMLLHIYFSWMAVRLQVFSVTKIIIIASMTGSLSLLLKVPVDMVTQNPILQIVIISFSWVLLMTMMLFFIERNGAVKDLMELWKRKDIL